MDDRHGDLTRRAWLGLGLAGVTLVGARPHAQPATGAARVVVETPRVDLGPIGFGTSPEATFRLRNDGDVDLSLTVDRVPPGILVTALPDRVPAGRSVDVRVTLDTLSSGPGPEWVISVRTTDETTPVLNLTIGAEIRAFVVITPAAARFSYVQHEREGGMTHVVVGEGAPDFRVLRVESPYPFLLAEAVALTAADRPAGITDSAYQLRVSITRTAPVGPLAGHVVLHTSHPRQPRAWLPVTGFVRPLLAATPPRVVLPTPTATPVDGPTLLITNFGEAALDLVEVRTTLDGVSAVVTPVEPGRRWHVRLVVGPSAAGGASNGRLIVETSRRDVPALEVALEVRR